MRCACLLSVAASVLFGGCAGPAPYTFHYKSGRTASLHDGYASAPPAAPAQIQAAIAAGNRIVGSPYVRGGGHGTGGASAFDCSGAASFVLQAAGQLRSSMPSRGFRRYGQRGDGKWISIYARRDHVFLVIAGLRFDTGWTDGLGGPQWTTRSRPTRGCVIRHPAGL